MSCFPVPKKLKQLPSSTKKALTSFTSTISPKLHRLRNRTSRLLDFRHKRRRSNPCPLPRGSGRFYCYNKHQYHQHYQHLQPYSSGPNSPATVYIDRLFGEASTSSKDVKDVMNMEASTSGGGDGGGDNGDEKKRRKVANDLKEYVLSMPKIKGVDERAEEFISKFHQQMSLQREQSLIEFQEMLARSS